MNNLDYWDKLKRPPSTALKQIKGGRLSGMTDISPMWRYQAMTEMFGPVGGGWKYEIVRMWIEPATEGQSMAFAEIKLYVRYGDAWSDAIPGIGGSAFIAKEKNGLYSSDECYKMAITDALSVAMKMVGVGADIYMGAWDGSKYRNDATESPQTQKPPQPMQPYAQGANRQKNDTPAHDLAYWKTAASAECDNADELTKWYKDNKAEIDKLSKPDQAELIKHCGTLKAEMQAKPQTVECPLGGVKTGVDCKECESNEKCTVKLG